MSYAFTKFRILYGYEICRRAGRLFNGLKMREEKKYIDILFLPNGMSSFFRMASE